MYIIREWAGNKQSGFTKGAVAKSSHICSSTFWIERFIRRRMPLSVLVCICFNFCSVNEHWFEFNLADFRKLLNKLVKKPFRTSVHVFSRDLAVVVWSGAGSYCSSHINLMSVLHASSIALLEKIPSMFAYTTIENITSGSIFLHRLIFARFHCIISSLSVGFWAI